MSDKTGISWCDATCTICRATKRAEEFCRDATRPSGRAYVCRSCMNARARAKYVPKGPPERYGPAPDMPRSGDKAQARQRVNVEVRTGRRAHPNTLPCADCGHVWGLGERRHEYDHHLGYAAEHHLCVQPVCTTCHHKRDNVRAKKTHCVRAHEFTPSNTTIRANGTRACRECMRERERLRPPRGAAYWAKVNAMRRHANG